MTTTLRASRRISATSTLSATPSRARVRAPFAFRASLLAASSVVAIGLVTAFGSSGARATDGTWNGTTSNQWNDGTNWSSTPNAPDGVATFTTNNPTSIMISGAVVTTAISTVQFNAGASAYTFTVNNTMDFETNGTVTAQGIVNNSTAIQTFINNSTMTFHGGTSAGNANVNITNTHNLIFTANSTGGNAAITNTNTVDFSQSTGLNNDGKLSAGSIAGAGTFELGADQLTVGGNNQSTTVTGVIADGGGAGGTGASLVKIGTGTLTLAGANTYTGPTTVMAGALALTGSLTSDVTVTGGIFGGSGSTSKTLTVQNGGTVAPGVLTPGTTFATLNVTGNATFASGSTFVVNINGQGQNDKLSVLGTATLNGGTVNVNALSGTGITTASTFTILTALGGVTGRFQNVTPSNNLAFLTPILTLNQTSVVLSFTAAASPPPPPPPPPPATPGNTPNVPANSPFVVAPSATAGTIVLAPGTFAAVATTPNQISTANAVQALGSGPVFNAVIGQSVAGAQQAFTALSGEVHASTVNAAFTDATLPNTAILDRLNQPVTPPVRGAATETTATYAADLPSRKGRVAPVAVQMYQPRMFDLWGEGFGDWGRVSSDGNAASLSRTTGGFVLGGDVSATNFMGGDWRFGVAGGYTSDSITVNQRGSSATLESVFGGVYGGASFGAFQLRAGALYGTNTTSTTRQVVFPGFFEALSSSNGGYTAQGFGEAGYRIQLAGLGFGGGSRVSVEPFAGAAAFLIHQNGFTEVGGTSALTASARDFDVQTTTLGVRGELAFASMPLTLKTMLGWRHAYGDVVPSVLLTFQGGAQAFSVSGVPIDRDAFVAEAGIDYALTSMLSVGVSYSGQFGQRATDNAFKGNVNLRF
jgi:outer membrane autotransporter protein